MKRLRLDRPRPFSDQCRLSDKYLLEHDPTTNFKMMAGVLKEKSVKYKENCMGNYQWANPRCKRRLQQMINAIRFMSKAQSRTKITEGLTAEEQQEQVQVYESTLEDLKGVLGEDGIAAMELKDKIQQSAMLKKDPEGTVKRMLGLLTMLTMGTPEEKNAAKVEIQNMPSSSPPLSAAEEREAEAQAETLRALEEQHAGEIDQALDEAELVQTDDRSDEQADQDPQWLERADDYFEVMAKVRGTSALEVRRDGASMTGRAKGLAKLVIFVVVLVAIVAMSVWINFVIAYMAYAIMAFFGCGIYQFAMDEGDDISETLQNSSSKRTQALLPKMEWDQCMFKVLLFPVKTVYQGGRYVWRQVFSRNTTKTGQTRGNTSGY